MMIEIFIGVFILFVFFIFYKIGNNVRKCIKYCENISRTDYSESVSIIKPSKGSNEFTLTNFYSWINQRYDSPIEYIFSFDDEDDTGIKFALEIIYDDKKILINPIKKGFTGKMSALSHGLENSKYDLIIFSDGDTRAYIDTLSKIMNQFKKDAKIVTCLAKYKEAKNIWSRIYASLWNLVEIGVVGTSILNHGDQVVGNTFALSKKTLKNIGGLDKYKNFIAEDIAIGKNAKAEQLTIILGPLIDSPVGRMTFSRTIDKFSRAALYTITMRRLKENWQFIIIYSYFFVVISPAILFGKNLFLIVAILALGRLILASYLWFVITDEKRVFVECFIEDILFLFVYIRALINKTTTWSGIKYRVYPTGRVKKID